MRTQPRYVVRKGSLLVGDEAHLFLQKDGESFGAYETAKRFKSQSAADKAGIVAVGLNFGIFPCSLPRALLKHGEE